MAQVDFGKINAAALADLPRVLRRWLPDARVVGDVLVARNPTRADRRPGSFKINLRSGQWADFVTNDRGGDVVSYVAFITSTGQLEAARHLADVLGIPAEA